MSFSRKHIKENTAKYIEQALEEHVVVSPSEHDRLNGQHPVSGFDLETPTSLVAGLLELWTVDMGYSDREKAEIETIVNEAAQSSLPDELVGYL